MAYEPQLQPGEKLIRHFVFQVAKKTEPLNFAVSDQAIYLPGKKLIALNDPYYFRRVPNNQVQVVGIRRLSPYFMWFLAGIMILAGLGLTYAMMQPLLTKQPGQHRVSGWPFAIFVGGLILPFAARGRFGLQIQTSDKGFKWKPPMVVDRVSKQKVTELLNEIARVCQGAGLRVLDEREQHRSALE